MFDRDKKELEKAEAKEKGVGMFSIRAVVYPDGPHTVSDWIGVVAVAKDKLKELSLHGFNKVGCP